MDESEAVGVVVMAGMHSADSCRERLTVELEQARRQMAACLAASLIYAAIVFPDSHASRRDS